MFSEAPRDDGESEKGDGKTPEIGTSKTHEDRLAGKASANDFMQLLLFNLSDSTSNDDLSATPRKQPESSSAMSSHDMQWLKFATYNQIKRHVMQTQANQVVEHALLSRGELLQLSYQPGGLRTLLLGTVCTASPLSRLRGYPQLTKQVWEMVKPMVCQQTHVGIIYDLPPWNQRVPPGGTYTRMESITGRRHTCFTYSDYSTPHTTPYSRIINLCSDYFWPSDRDQYRSNRW
jgi:hypothetical protein